MPLFPGGPPTLSAEVRYRRLDAYQRHADICKVLTDPKRLMILDALRGREMAVGAIAEELQINLANASQHLGILRSAALVTGRRSGTSVLYRLTEPKIAEACDIIDAIVRSRDPGALPAPHAVP